MKKELVLLAFLFSLFSIVGCNKQDPAPIEEEPYPALGEYPKQLVQQDSLIQRIFISPDGKYVAFYSLKYTFNPQYAWSPPELWVMRSDGFDLRRVILRKSIYNLTIPTFICWEDDSRSMIVHIDDGSGDYKSEIWQIDITGVRTKLYAPNLRLENLTYSPDKSKLAYIIQGPNLPMGPPVYKLYVANTDFTDSIRIEKGLIEGYQWQLDSKALIYSLYDRPNLSYDFWNASIDGTNKLRLSQTPEYKEYFSISSDGKQMAYIVSHSMYVTSTDHFLPQFIIDQVSGPAWIPGRNLLKVHNEQTNGKGAYWTESWIVDLQGNIIKKFPKGVFELTFFPDGHHFIYTEKGSLWMDYLP